MKIHARLYIDGGWLEPETKSFIQVVDPSTEEICGRVAVASAADVDKAVLAARRAFASWSTTTADVRAAHIRRLAEVLTQHREELAQIISLEVGIPLWFAREVHVNDPIDALRKHADYASALELSQTEGNATVVFEPVGVCGFINPWNYPLHQLISKVAPALAAGCTMVVKPSEVTPLHAFLFAELVHQAGLPAGVFNLVSGDGAGVGEPLCRHREIDMVSFTGSTRAGIRVAQVAAESVKRVCQELGGKSPFLICEDADLDAAVKLGVEDVMLNSGQTCTALTRMLVSREQYEEAVEVAVRHTRSLKVGHPADPDTFMGPLVSRVQLDTVTRYIEIGLQEGAKLAVGGNSPEDMEAGYYFNPTIFRDVRNDMRIAQEEIFGPVLCMIPYNSEEEAVRLANDSAYGLSARVWSADPARAVALARQIKAGQVYVNSGEWNNQAPFGGYKQSGNGRELGEHGVREFLEIKAIIR